MRTSLPPLRPYQTDGAAFLVNNTAALLADEMGLGKTVQAAVALRALSEAGELSRSLIVVPSALRFNWERELTLWAPQLAVKIVEGPARDRNCWYQLPIPVLIASYEQIRDDALRMLSDTTFDVVILDEAQRIKNKNSATALGVRLLKRHRSWALSGTPVENSLDDLVALFAFVSPGLRVEGLPLTALHQRIKPTFLRRLKQDVLQELPPIIDQTITLRLEGEQASSYDMLWNNRRELLLDEESDDQNTALLSVITKLKQICNFEPVSQASVKFEALSDIVANLSSDTDKLIVFSQFVSTLTWLQERLTTISVELLHGGMSSQERDNVVKRFEGLPGPQVILVSLRAGGVGLNLNSASMVVLFDRWWNPAVELQAVARAHRFGRLRPLQLVKFLVEDSVEERIDRILARKQGMIAATVDALATTDIGKLSAEDLRTILQLPPPSQD